MRINYKHSEEVKNKIANSLKGHLVSIETRKKLSLKNKGRKHTEEARKKISQAGIGNKRSLGIKRSEEFRRNLSLRMKGRYAGERNHWWKGGITPIHEAIRETFEYKLWRKSVFERDKYSCVWCKQVGGEIHADHIKPFALFPELRFAIDNGRTLCKECHKKTDTYGRKTKKTI